MDIKKKLEENKKLIETSIIVTDPSTYEACLEMHPVAERLQIAATRLHNFGKFFAVILAAAIVLSAFVLMVEDSDATGLFFLSLIIGALVALGTYSVFFSAALNMVARATSLQSERTIALLAALDYKAKQ